MGTYSTRYPFVSGEGAFTILRIVTPLLFMAHAATRIANGTIPRFAQFMGNLGFPAPTAVVWLITLVELVTGTMILLNYKVRWAGLGLASIAFGGIVLIHAPRGWWVGEHGSGGSEYSVALLAMLLVLIARDADRAK